MPTPRLSIVVPFHNVEDFVTPCLASLRRQTLRDVEVVLVDDGSTDGTRARVEEYVASDDRFRVVEQEQSGPGPARNTGIAHSRGELLAFVDSDDLVPRRAFAHMVATLDATGSDMVAGNARRFNALGVRASYAHRLPFEETRLRTSMREFPELALDRMVWNKVYRRSFWDEHGLAFPDMLYEDYPVSMAAHAAARTVDVLEEPVYFWRERDGGELSITQHTWGMANLVDRVDSAEMVLASLEDPALGRARAKVAEHLLHIDVAAVISAVHLNDPAEHATILSLAQRLLAQVPAAVRDEAICFDRVQAHLVEHGRLPELEVLEGYRAENGVHAEVVTRGRWPRRRRYARLPFFGQDELVPPSAYLLPGDEPHLTPVVRDAVWCAGRLELDLDLGLGSFAVGPHSEVRVWLAARDGRRVELSPARYEIDVPHVGADLSGVHLSLDPMTLPDWDRPEWWVLHVGVRTPTYRGSAPVHHIGPNRGLFVGAAWLPGGVIAQPCRRQEVVGLWVRRPNAVVGRANGLFDSLELGGWFSAREVTDPVELVLESADGAITRLPVTLEEKREGSPPHRHPWSVRIPVAPFIEHGEDVDPVEERQRVMVRLVVNGGERNLVPGTEFSGGYAAQHSRSVVATRSPIGQLVLLEGNTAPRLVDVTWADEGTRLVLGGVWEGAGALPDHVVVRRYTRARNVCEVRVPLAVEHGAFTAVVDVEELIDAPEQGPGPAETTDPDQLWHLLFDLGETVMVPVVSRDLPSAMPGPREVRGGAATLFLDRGDVVRVHVRRP